MARFDINKARKAGKSDAEILDYLAPHYGFNPQVLRDKGVPDKHILNYVQDVTDLPSITDPAAKLDVTGATARFLRGADAGIGSSQLGIQQLLGRATPEQVDVQRGLNAPLLQTPAGGIGSMVGNAAPWAALSMLGNPGSLLGAVAQQGLLGAAQGAVTPLGSGETGQRLINAAWGGAGGVAGGGLGYGLGRLLTPIPNIPPERLALADKVKAMGVPLSPAQITGSGLLGNIESMAGGAPEAAATRQAAFNDYFSTAASRALGPEDLQVLQNPAVVDVMGNVQPEALWRASGGMAGSGPLNEAARTMGKIDKTFPPVANGGTSAMRFLPLLAHAGVGGLAGGAGSFYYGARDPGELAVAGGMGGVAGMAGPKVLQSIIGNPVMSAYLSRGLLGGADVAPWLASTLGRGAAQYEIQEHP